MIVTELDIPDLLIIEPKRFGDDRGWFLESWQSERYGEAGLAQDFVQDNLAYSRQGVLRGLHAQQPFAQGKLVQVYMGQVFDVAVDLRKGSPTFGQWHGILLSADKPMQFFVPPGFGHGYCVLSDEALFGYKCTETYHPETEFSVRWDDPDIGIDWPPLDGEPQLSEKDRDALNLKQIPPSRLTPFEGA